MGILTQKVKITSSFASIFTRADHSKQCAMPGRKAKTGRRKKTTRDIISRVWAKNQ